MKSLSLPEIVIYLLTTVQSQISLIIKYFASSTKSNKAISSKAFITGIKNLSLAENWFGILIFCQEKRNLRIFALLADEMNPKFSLSLRCFFFAPNVNTP